MAIALPWRGRRVAAGRRRLSAAWYEAHGRRRRLWYGTFALATSVVLAQVLLRIGPAAVVLPIGALALAAVAWRPEAGLYLLYAVVLLFEMSDVDPLMTPGRYFYYGFQSSLGISGLIVSPLELLLILTAVFWIVKGLVEHTLTYRGGDLGWPMALFFLALVGGVMRGAAEEDGDLYVAFWEARSLLYLGAAYVLAVNLVRTRRAVAAVLAVTLVANGLYALEGLYRFLFLIRPGLLDVAPEFHYGHEVVILLAVLMLQALALVVVRGPRWMQLLGVALAPAAFLTLLATHRRAGYIALAIAFVFMALPWLVRHRKAVMLIVLPGVFAAAVYLPLFWNNSGVLGQPARAVKSLYEPDERDASSNQYRELEKINVMGTIDRDPLLGVGFGRKFEFFVPLPDLSWWPFWHYQPHHNILWVWLKTGAPGFTIFWILMLGALALASSRSLTLADPVLVTFAYVAIASIVTTLVFCYVDLGLTNGRVTVFLGIVLGVLAALRQIERTTATPGTADAGAPTPRGSGAPATPETAAARAGGQSPGVARASAGAGPYSDRWAPDRVRDRWPPEPMDDDWATERVTDHPTPARVAERWTRDQVGGRRPASEADRG